MSADSVLIVGGGPAGLSCGIRLLRNDPSREVTVLEKESEPGGISGGFRHGGLSWDYGSHRIHPSTGRDILDFLGSLGGLALVRRRRNGRILLGGRLVRFPPSPLDAVTKLPPALSRGILLDQIVGLAGRRMRERPSTFEEAIEAGMGRSMARAFYIPYSRKLWGLEAGEISASLAARRVPAAVRGGLLRKVLGGLPVLSRLDPTRYFRYPEGGFSSLALALAGEFERLGGRLFLGTQASRLGLGPGSVEVTTADGVVRSAGHVVWSAPLDALGTAARGSAPDEVVRSALSLEYRQMLLLYVQLGDGPYTPYDAHYFPGPETRFSRMSEPSNYPRSRGRGPTGLCLELPCGRHDEPDGDAGKLLLALEKDLRGTPLPSLGRASDAWVRRLSDAYPVYRLGFEKHLDTVRGWSLSYPRVTLVGRQGLFSHDNVHHAIETGLAAADCLSSGSRDTETWARLLGRFDSRCVSD